MFKKLLPLISIVLAFNFFLYYYFSTKKPEVPAKSPVGGVLSSKLISVPMINDPGDDLLVIHNDSLRLSFSKKSGILTQWSLVHYLSEDRKTPIDLLKSHPGYMGGGLLVKEKNGLVPLPLTGLLANNSPLSSDNVSAPSSGLILRENFSFEGHPVFLTYTIPSAGYRVNVSIDNPDKLPLSFMPGLNFGMTEGVQSYGTEFQGPIYADSAGKMTEFKKDQAETFSSGMLSWVGNETKYFIGYLSLSDLKSKTEIIKDNTQSLINVEIPEGTSSFSMVAEPKRYSLLKKAEPGLIDTVDFGWFLFGRIYLISFLAKFLFLILSNLFAHLGNYGFSIIMLTILIKLLFSPLTYLSYRSMHQMQQLQPEIKKLQAKFKDDRAQLNQAMMELYKERRINPLGGCLPVLVQIPVFVALYNILNNTVELRQAPFLLWIHDLSLKDPYYVFPIIMGISMLIQTRLTPTTPDPMQRRIMLFMPVVMTFFFLNFPSGLVLYWIVNNVLTIGQQYFTMRFIFKVSPAK